MGYEIAENTTDLFVIYPDETAPREFDPLFNADQSMDLLKMLLGKGAQVNALDNPVAYTFDMYTNKRYRTVEAESLEQAILNAVWEHVSNEQS